MSVLIKFYEWESGFGGLVRGRLLPHDPTHLAKSTYSLSEERSGCVNRSPKLFQKSLAQLLRNPGGFLSFSCTFDFAFAAPQAFASA